MSPNRGAPRRTRSAARLKLIVVGNTMPLHLIKLCVGAELIADLEEWVAERVAERVRRGGAPRSQHVTRMVPARAAGTRRRRLALLGHQRPARGASASARDRAVRRRRRHPALPALARSGSRAHPSSADAPVSGLALFRRRGRAARPRGGGGRGGRHARKIAPRARGAGPALRQPHGWLLPNNSLPISIRRISLVPAPIS